MDEQDRGRMVIAPDLSDYPELLKPKDVQAILRVSQYRAYRLFHSKGFPMVTLGATGLFIPKARLMVWLGYGTSDTLNTSGQRSL
jgi:hypothetical protein